MSTAKSFATFFALAVLGLHELTEIVNGVPVQKASRNDTRIASLLRPPLKRNSSQRSGRFLGKFSFMAGLGLPDPMSPPPQHPSDRADIIYDLRAPPPSVSSLNFPGARWGPYFAAVYEPVPVFSFYENPFGYLADYLNPYNWFGDGSSTSTVKPEHSTIQGPLPVKNQEVVLLVEDNEIPSENRKSTMDNMEMKTVEENENDDKIKLQKIMNALTVETLIKIKEAVTKKSDTDNNADLIAEETTIKLVEANKEDEDIDRQGRPSQQPQRHTTRRAHTTTRAKTTKAPTTIEPTTLEVTTIEDEPSGMTEMITTPTHVNNVTNSTALPEKLSTWYPSNLNGYYYGGQPQNVSHVEFTTPATLTTTSAVSPLQIFNNINRIPQQLPPNYYDAFEPPVYEFNNRFDQFPADSNDYYNRENEFLSNNDFNANGFKPSFPFLF